MQETLKKELIQIVGSNNVIDDPKLFGPFTDDFTDHYQSAPLAVVRPADTKEVSEVLKLCSREKIGVVPQGGNTNLTGSAATFCPNAEVVLSLTRMKKVMDADPLSDTLTVQAGMTLEQVHAEAEKIGRFFPLSFGAKGNATIGGCCACNAGGTAVLRYGTTRELVLGIEAVLPDGNIYKGLRKLRKDNTGYDFKDLFIGSEGTLGVITAAVLKLFPIPVEKETALVSLESPDKAVLLLNFLKQKAGSALTAFELISDLPIGRVKKYLPDIEVPELSEAPWRALIELSLDKKPGSSLIEATLEEAFEKELLTDALIACSIKDAHNFWHIRESIPLADRTAGGSIHSDISLPISAIAEFLAETEALLTQKFPWLGLSIYGHLGDGNLHYNVVCPEDPERPYREEEAIREALYAQVNRFNGSISAEHGIGMLKLEHNYEFKDPLEFEMMRKIKDALDPAGIMNPGKLLKVS